MRRFALTIIFGVATFAASAQQSSQLPAVYLGPILGYTAVVSAPEGSSVTGTPARVSLGIDVAVPLNQQATLRFTGAYRLEQAEYSTTVDPLSRPQVVDAMIDVGEPDGTALPTVTSRQTLGAFELSAAIQFVVLPLGSEGSHVFAGIGGMIDNVVSASQDDDWSGVPDLPAEYPKKWEYDLGGQLGGGGVAYAGVDLSLGSAHLIADVRYVARTPLGDARVYDWLAGRGVRIGMSMWFPL